MWIHNNFIRPHQSPKGQTSAEVAGINLNLKENEGIKKERRQARNVCYTDQSELRPIPSLHTINHRPLPCTGAHADLST
jgi:hypothetical protein